MTPFLVFDLDGTLSDPAVGVLRSINHALGHFGYPALPAADISACIGPPIDQTFARLSGSADAGHVAALVARYRERYAATGYAENTLYTGIVDVLATLADRGVPMGVCTSKRVDFAERILRLFGLREHFTFVSGGEDGASKSQHLAALVRGGQVPGGSTMIGDRAIDVLAGRDNGLRTVGVLWGHGSRAELHAAGADVLVDSPAELAHLAHPDMGTFLG